VRIGIFGGTFDPPHVGHLLAASDACEALSLDRLAFVPNAQQPLKREAAMAGAEDRLEMVRCLTAGDPRFEVDGSEVRRGGLSYTVETLREYRVRMPAAALILLIGEDVVDTLPAWREIGEIRAMADIVVLTRAVADAAVAADGVRRLPTRRLDLSSTEIRDRAAAGRPLTGFVPPAVAAYIEEHRLYRARAAAPAPRRNEP
jgi:nicotinate-nucleotide adenylyltransferase